MGAGQRAKEAKGKDTEVMAEKDMAAKAKESAKDTEAKACMVWILWEQTHGELKAYGAASNLGEIKIMAMSNGEDMKEPVISDRWPRWPKHTL